MGLAPKGSKSVINDVSRSYPYAPNNPVDRRVREELSRGAVAEGRTIRLPGEMVAMASPRTRAKANAIAEQRNK